ncbi:MAG TPA: hypothetical protein DDW74_10680 [Porphyromonadaceae bacterium]|nr:hypothetical protein [Porphyromonadaceae bacterium]HBK41317.1 hypothetical protein [Porphyromonadaceae bacterium]HCF80691.1 hypothetical protein [Porphyromonadaceae bacterium]
MKDIFSGNLKAHSPQKVHLPKSIQTGFPVIAPVGHNSTRAASSTPDLVITGLPLNIPGNLAFVTSGIYCFP